MVMPPCSSSSSMQSIRRELQRRRAKPLAPKKPSPPPPRPPHQEDPSLSTASKSPPGSNGTHAHLRPGTAVGVRTRTTKLKTGKVLVLWLRAMVVSPTHDGYEVVYDVNWPPGDPYGTVHVPRRHVRMIKPLVSPTTPPPSLPPSCAPSSSASATTASARKKEMRPAPRPTTAGKSLRLIRSLWPELERQARAALPG